VGEAMMKPDHWLELVVFVLFSALTLMVGYREGHPVCKNPCVNNSQKFSFRTDGGGEPRRNWLTQAYLEKMVVKQQQQQKVVVM